MASKMQLGYIARFSNPGESGKKFALYKASYTRKITSRGDKVYSKMLCFPADYEDVADNTKTMEDDSGLILVTEPFFLNEELEKKVTRWIDWANSAKQEEYDPFAEAETPVVDDNEKEVSPLHDDYDYWKEQCRKSNDPLDDDYIREGYRFED